MDLFGLPVCAQVAWAYMITILCSGCTDLQNCHFVLRPYGPIQLPFCAQVLWTYMILIYKHSMSINFENISLLVSGCMDLLANKKHAQVAWTYLDCQFVLRLLGPI